MLQAYTLTGDRTIQMAGDFLRYDNDTDQAIRVRADGQDFGHLWPGEAVELPAPVGLWEIKGPTDAVPASGTVRTGIGRIRTARRAQMLRAPVLTMETDAGQVAAGAGPGWVSGTPANLAASASVGVVFDLGPDWRQYATAQLGVLPMGPSTGMTSVQVMGSDSTTPNPARRLKDWSVVGNANSAFAVNTSSNGHGYTVRPFGRFLIVSVTNADATNALGAASKVSLAAYPT